MKKNILVLQNVTHEKLGILKHVMDDRNYNYTEITLEDHTKLPDLTPYDALVVMGGWDSANDTTPKMLTELEIVKQALKNKMPYMGICLGLQVLVKAAGGSVIKNSVKEVGFIDSAGDTYAINLTQQGKQDPLFKGLSDDFPVFQLHGETVVLTPNMTLLGIGDTCMNQVVKVQDNAYGIQCHFELTKEMFLEWLDTDPDLMVLNKQNLITSFDAIEEAYTLTGKTLFNNFLDLI